MEILRIGFILLLLLTVKGQDYTLQLDWSSNATSPASGIGYVTWN